MSRLLVVMLAGALTACGQTVEHSEQACQPQWVRDLTERPCPPIDPALDRWVERNDIVENGNTDQPM